MATEEEIETDEESMPGYHEMEEETDLLRTTGGEQNHDQDKGYSSVSDRFFESHSHKPTSRTKLSSDRPGGSSNAMSPVCVDQGVDKPMQTDSILERHTCPICAKILTVDNQGLNSHIDFCLSKGAIMEAQTTTYRGKKPATFSNMSKSK